jgi:DNA-binding IclR family transcriptional regulator
MKGSIMTTCTAPYQSGCDPELLAVHLLRALCAARVADRSTSLDDLVGRVGARRGDVRRMLSALHREGLVDVVRMRPTLEGFALGRALAGKRLRPFRILRATVIKAA